MSGKDSKGNVRYNSFNDMAAQNPDLALHYAAESGDIDLAKTILGKGNADINHVDSSGFTPLFRAAMKEQKSFILFMLKNGADPNIQTREGFTPLMAAVESGNVKLVEIFIKHRANPDIQTIHGTTSLHIAAAAGKTEIIKLLIKSGADINIRDRTDIKKILEQQAGQEIKITGGDEKVLYGLTARDVARMCGHTEAEKLLAGRKN
jgi:ankyrin